MTMSGWPFSTAQPVQPPNVDQTQPPSGAPSFASLFAFGTFFIDTIVATGIEIVAKAFGFIPLIGPTAEQFLDGWATNLETAAANALATANGAQTTATAATTVQSQQATAKPGYVAVDATGDAVFPIMSIPGPTPTTVNVVAGTSAIGLINTEDNGKKLSAAWYGNIVGTLTGFYLNVYKLDVTTNVLTLLDDSVDILSSVAATVADENLYDLTTPIDTSVGDWYAVEFVVTGSGTYEIVGLPGHWLPPKTLIYPKLLGATRDTTGGITAPSTFTPTYSSDVPWALLGGDLFGGPTTSEYSTAGSDTYPIPTWMKWGDLIDVLVLSAGGGGQSSTFGAFGAGGTPGVWTIRTLVYGVDIPLSTSSLAVVVGAGGAPGSGAGNPGTAGGDSSVSGTGVTTITSAGGVGGSGGGIMNGGAGPGDQTLHTENYTGGAAVGVNTPGSAPGGAGGGGGSFSDGQPGATGAVWLAAYKAGTNP
jgi:hypothetical protein